MMPRATGLKEKFHKTLSRLYSRDINDMRYRIKTYGHVFFGSLYASGSANSLGKCND